MITANSFWQMCSGNSFYMVTVISFWANVILATWPAFALHFKNAKMVNVALDCIDLCRWITTIFSYLMSALLLDGHSMPKSLTAFYIYILFCIVVFSLIFCCLYYVIVLYFVVIVIDILLLSLYYK